MPRVAVVTVLLCSYYFEFVVLFAYFLTRFSVVAVFQFLLGLCKPICYIYPCCQFFFLVMINLLHISMLSIFFFLVMINLLHISMLSIFFFSDDQFTLQLSESEVEEEEDEGVPDLPGRYSLIIN